MQQVCEQLGLNATHTLDGNHLHLQSEVVVWVPRGGLFAGAGSDFSSIAGKWDPRTLSLDITEHEIALSCTSSSLSDSGSSLESNNELWFETDLESRTPARRAANSKTRKREPDTLLEGRMKLVRILSRGSNLSAECQEINIEGIDTAVRFDVPSDRSIPFVLTSEELRRFKEGTDDTNSLESQSTAAQQRMESSQEPASGRRDNTTTSASLAESPSSPSSAFTNSISSTFQHAVQEMRKTTRIVYTWGTIGLKWLTRATGAWTYVAFRSTDDCFVWMSLLRKIIVSHLRFQTFQEVFQVKLQFDPALTLNRPDLRGLVEVFTSHDHSKHRAKSKDPRIPPSKGILTFRNGDRVNKWHVFLDKHAIPNASHPSAVQILHCVKVGKTLIEGPRNSLLNFTRAHVSSQDIDLRKCTIHVPKPFSNQFFLEQRQDTGNGIVVSRLEAVADSMEARIAWEEWLQTFGATKILSEEEAEAKDNILGGTMHEITMDDEEVDECVVSEETPRGSSALLEGKKLRHRQLSGRIASGSPFAWLTSASRPRSPSIKNISSERLGSPVSPTPSKAGPSHSDAASSSSKNCDVSQPQVQYALPEFLRHTDCPEASSADPSYGGDHNEKSRTQISPPTGPIGGSGVAIQIDAPTPQVGPSSSPDVHEKLVIELPRSIASCAADYLGVPGGDENSPITPKEVKLTSPHSSEELVVCSNPPSVPLPDEGQVSPEGDVAEALVHATETDDVSRTTLKWVLAQQNSASSITDRLQSLQRKAAAVATDHEGGEIQPPLHHSISRGSMEFSALVEGMGALGFHRAQCAEASGQGHDEDIDAPTERATSLVFDGSRGFFQQDPVSMQDLKRSFLNSLTSFRRVDTPDQLHADRASESTAPTRIKHQRRLSADSSSSALSSDDAELVADNPVLRSTLMSNLKSQRVCPLCGGDKREVSVCKATGRRHAVASTTTAKHRKDTVGGIGDSLSFLSPPRQQRRFIREPNESTEVAAARILLELE